MTRTLEHSNLYLLKIAEVRYCKYKRNITEYYNKVNIKQIMFFYRKQITQLRR